MKVGDRVALRDDECHGTVQELVDDDTVRVLLDGEELLMHIVGKSKDGRIVVEDDGGQLTTLLDEEWRAIVQEHINKSAEHLKAARELATAHGVEQFNYGEFDVSAMDDAMHYSYWVNSSLQEC